MDRGASPGRIASAQSGPLMMIVLISSILIIRSYPIDQDEHGRILNAIREMKAESA
jgi:hypothetical protein